MASLRMVDVDLEHRILVVRSGKGGVDRALPIATVLADLLVHAGPDEVLPYHSGDAVSRAVRDHFRRVGIEHRAHDLRHAFATEAARVTNGNMTKVAQLMGHASIATTSRYVAALPVGRDVVDALWCEAA